MAVQLQTAITKPMQKYDFTQPKIAQSTTGTLNIDSSLATAGTLNVKEYTMVWGGSIVGIAARLSETHTDGTLTVTPLINGSLTGFSGNTTTSSTKVPYIYATQEADTFQSRFAAGDRLALRYLTDAAFAPNTQVDGDFQIFVLYDEVRI